MDAKKVLVFGGTGVIGTELSLLLKDEGYDVSITGKSKRQNLEGYIQCDAKKIIRSAVKKNSFGKKLDALLSECDVLVLCYGPFVQKPLEKTLCADWYNLALYDYALSGMLVSAALPHMIKNNFGRILIFGGTNTEDVRSFKTNAAYAGAKTGLSVLVKSVAASYSQYNITCNAVLPGYVSSVPEGKTCVSAKTVAQEALNLIKSQNVSGVLLNVDS